MSRGVAFKRLVRARMEKTGESYTAARAVLPAAEEPQATEKPALATSDEAIRRRTGRGWEEWFDLLDDWGDGETRVNVTFLAKEEAKTTVALSHVRLADAEEAERMKAYWRERIAAMKEVLER